MTLKDLKRLSTHRAFRAVLRHEARSGYLIELRSERGAGLLRGRGGEPLGFRSLTEAHRVMRQCGVAEIVLPEPLAA